MSDEKEPTRLRDDAATEGELRVMLDAVRGETADTAMLDRVLGNIVAGSGGAGPSSGATSAGKLASTIGAAVVGIAGVVALVVSSTSVSPPTRSVAAQIDAYVETDASIVIDAAVPVAAATDAYVPSARREPRPLPPPLESDEALMLRATREHDPALSLSLALAHRARFSASPLAEDREALVVVDLAALDRAAEARAAAEAFGRRWPRSAHQPHIDAALARMTPR